MLLFNVGTLLKQVVLIDDLSTDFRVIRYKRTVLANVFSGFKLKYAIVQCGYFKIAAYISTQTGPLLFKVRIWTKLCFTRLKYLG